jgi:hypothetical protein
MSKILRPRLALFCAFILLTLILPQAAQACEICIYRFFLGFSPCRPVTQSEVGSTNCTDEYHPIGGFTCSESGTFCSAIDADGGGGSGGGGGWGGGGSPCNTSGFCPAECFSCDSGGGRPAI